MLSSVDSGYPSNALESTNALDVHRASRASGSKPRSVTLPPSCRRSISCWSFSRRLPSPKMSSRASGTSRTTRSNAAIASCSRFCGSSRAMIVTRCGSRGGGSAGSAGWSTGFGTTNMLLVRPRRSAMSSRWRSVSVTSASMSSARRSTRV